MSVRNRDELLREAGALKLRAMRLRTFGEPEERWEASVLLRQAAKNELQALDLLEEDVSPQAQTLAMVEACGLFLMAGDPVSAARTWSCLPSWASSSDEGAALIDSVRHTLEGEREKFGRSVSSLAPYEQPHRIPRPQLIALVEEHPGVAELWWALSLHASDRARAADARAKALRLEPSFAEEGKGIDRWLAAGALFTQKWQAVLRAERPKDVLTLDLIGRVAATIGALLTSLAESVYGEPFELVPDGARSGSFIIDLTARGLPSNAIERLAKEIQSVSVLVDVKVLLELIALLETHRVRLSLSAMSPEQPGGADALIIDEPRRRVLREAAEMAARSRIDSNDIPQADDLHRVFLVAQLAAEGREASPESLGGDKPITPRQVTYYRRAAKILGLLSKSDELTSSGRLIARLRGEERLRAAVVHFESSVCGDAWIRWSKGRTMLDVDPTSAATFLEQSVVGLARDTFKRRAQTLVAWHRLLSPHHYAAPSTSDEGSQRRR